MFEKYLKLIKEKTSQKDLIDNFVKNELGLIDYSFDVIGSKVKLNCSAQDRFKLKIKSEEWNRFLKENNLLEF